MSRNLTLKEAEARHRASFAARALEIGLAEALALIDEQIEAAIEGAPAAMRNLGGSERQCAAHRVRMIEECARTRAECLDAYTRLCAGAPMATQ